MRTRLRGSTLAFELPAARIATRPFEASGRRRDEAPMLVSWRSRQHVVDARVADLRRYLEPGDLLVVNQSATIAAAVPVGDGRIVHLSTQLGGEQWVVELRQAYGHGSLPLLDQRPGPIGLPGGGEVELLTPYEPGHDGPVPPVAGPASPAGATSRLPVRAWATGALRL